MPPRAAAVVSTIDRNGLGQVRETVVERIPMRMETFTSARVADPETLARQLDRLQQSLMEATLVARSVPFLSGGGRLHRSLSFTSGTAYTLRHGLGRAYEGYFLLRKRVAAGDVFEVAASPVEAMANYIVLMPNATFTADVWVY